MTESHKELPQPASVEALGWRGFFDNQVTEEERSECTPARVIAVHRDALVVLNALLALGRELHSGVDLSAPNFKTGRAPS